MNRALLSLVSVLGLQTASASEPFENWHDACGYPSIIPVQYAAQVNKVIDAEAILLPASDVVQRTDDPNFYRLINHQTEHTWGGQNIETCQETPFRLENKYDVSGRSGFLIAPDLIATASHTYGSLDARAFTAVFGVAAHYYNGSCVPTDPEHIPAANVFRISSNADTINAEAYYWSQNNQHTGVDYAVFRLDAPATGRSYLRIRRTGQAAASDNTIAVGHPDRLGAKLFYGAKVVDFIQSIGVPSGFPAPAVDQAYFSEGSSGGPTYNLDRQYVETVEANGTIGGECALEFLPGSRFNPVRACDEIYDNCTDPIDDPSLDLDKPPFTPNLAPITLLAPLVDNGQPVNTPELRVSPLQDVLYVMPVGAAPSPSQSTYSLRASHAAPNTSVTTTVSVPTGQQQLLTLSGYNGSLAADSTATVTVTPSIPPNLGCGAYDHSLLITDSTHGFTDTIRHRFEIGLTEFLVAPIVGEDIYAIASPSVPTQVSYTLTNPRPTSVTVNFSSPQTWVALARVGPGGGSNSVTLAPAGQSGSTRQVNISLTSSAYSLADGDYSIDIVFANQSSCPVASQVHAHPTFHKGSLLLVQDLNYVQIPIPTPPESPVTSTIAVQEAFCVTDLSFTVDNFLGGPFIGEDFVAWAPHAKFQVDSPSPTISRVLWNTNAVPPSWLPLPADAEDDGSALQHVILNNTSRHPPTGALLSDFNGHAAGGLWKLSVWDNGTSPSRLPAELRQWQLIFKGTAGACP